MVTQPLLACPLLFVRQHRLFVCDGQSWYFKLPSRALHTAHFNLVLHRLNIHTDIMRTQLFKVKCVLLYIDCDYVGAAAKLLY